jgi:hypothetical protein
MQKLFLLFGLAVLLLPACGNSTIPTLGVAGMPTLVFIYTDG